MRRRFHAANALGALEPGQLTAATDRPLPRRKLGRGVLALLILLRVYVLLAIPLVGYAFIHALGQGKP
jgi:hypothetical protein